MADETDPKESTSEEGESFEPGVGDSSEPLPESGEKAPAGSEDGVDAGSGGEEATPSRSLDFILDIPLELTVELGRNRMLISDLLQLGQGSVVELSKLVGEPMEILVNQKLVARGEVVVVNEKFGIRLTDIISPMERIEHLR